MTPRSNAKRQTHAKRQRAGRLILSPDGTVVDGSGPHDQPNPAYVKYLGIRKEELTITVGYGVFFFFFGLFRCLLITG